MDALSSVFAVPFCELVNRTKGFDEFLTCLPRLRRILVGRNAFRGNEGPLVHQHPGCLWYVWYYKNYNIH